MTTDSRTLAAYADAAADYARDWDEQPAPLDMYALLTTHFKPGPTADIGCGSGRDMAWLAAHGFQVYGFDASPELLAHARQHHPDLSFAVAALPALEGMADASFQNVLCETVVMHLSQEQLIPAVKRLLAILRPGGTLYLSWRVAAVTERDKAGRLYAAIDKQVVLDQLAAGDEVVFDRFEISASSGKPVQRMVVYKGLGA
ncbi:MAG TPA: class I SAM-dependent methyltransferase [Dyella sp.]|uniref:class I SAM-dependent methyltransferase n=1 Tax=Dyella sp. TaxID=1869338 RepID=UPI002D775108|nr:class I SAM-dependent methyltransferase [Dyella sp.]HET6552670.1 class I SAM-dependent methyltransferase [Dyella sp.]